MVWTQNRPTRITAITRQTESNDKFRYTKKRKKTKFISWAIQYLSKYIKNISANTNFLRKLQQNNNEWNRKVTEEHTNAFNKLKENITIIPCLAHCNAQFENILTTVASTKGLGATLWQRQKDGN